MAKSIMLIMAMTAVMIVGFLQSQLVIPADISTRPCLVTLKMQKMGYPAKLASSVVMASAAAKLPPELIISLMRTESDFNEKAVSNRGYKGLMQIPLDVFDPDANILIGAKILKEKLVLTKGNLEQAIILYKGYANDQIRGRIQARKVLRLYRQLQEMEMEV